MLGPVVVIFEAGEEVATGKKRFAEENHLAGSGFKAIGALSGAKLGWFNWQTKAYETAVEFKEQIEVLSLIGDVALKDGQPAVHAHMIVGRKDGTAHGGHLIEAYVRPTLEVVLTESSQALRKAVDRESGLALIQP